MSELNLAERLAKYSTPTLAESSSHVVVLPPVIAPLFRPIQLSGPVYSVLAMPGDNLAVHLALAEAPGGSVLVVATGPELQKGFWGEIMTEAALARKIRGLVTDGAVRDTRPIRESAFPVFCAGVAISGTTKISPGVLNQPVRLATAYIRPGDFVVGDEDGVVIIPPEKALGVLENAEARVVKEFAQMKRLREGELTVDLLNLRGQGVTRNG